jgi:hypothetical protein
MYPRPSTYTAKPLHNQQIEKAERTFFVTCVLFGSRARDAQFEVLAATPKGAIKIARSFYPRSDGHKAQVVGH